MPSDSHSNDARSSKAPERSPTAVLLIAHGSRRAEANEDLAHVARGLRERGAYDAVEIAYLELAEPTIPQGVRACVERGARRVLMLPYFLSSGTHVTDDLEKFRAEAAGEYPQATFVLCAPLGLHPLLLEVVLARLAEGEDASASDDRGD